MTTLFAEIRDPDVVIALDPSELGRVLMKVARAQMQNSMFHPNNLTSGAALYPSHGSQAGYPHERAHALEEAIGEAWHWLELNMLIMPAPDMNGRNGWKVFTRRGQSMKDDAAFEQFRRAGIMPRDLLHPVIAERVWVDLARGQYADAVFKAFRAVEEAVRDAGGYTADDYGEELVRKAFNSKGGPLARGADPDGEKRALGHLFAGALGSYKNPHSHRTVTISDPLEAQEMVILASHLLRIVDARRPALP